MTPTPHLWIPGKRQQGKEDDFLYCYPETLRNYFLLRGTLKILFFFSLWDQGKVLGSLISLLFPLGSLIKTDI